MGTLTLTFGLYFNPGGLIRIDVVSESFKPFLHTTIAQSTTPSLQHMCLRGRVVGEHERGMREGRGTGVGRGGCEKPIHISEGTGMI